MVKQIVVGTDGSNESLHAFNQALSMAGKVHAALKCVFIVDLRKTQMPFIYSGAAYEGAYERLYIPPDSSMRTFYEKLASDLDEFAKKCMDSCRAKAEKAGVEFESIVKSGYPGMELCDEARSGGLLAVGQRGENAHYKRSIVGSITEDLIRISPRPLLICPDSRVPVRSALVPYDGSRAAEHVLQFYVNGIRHIAEEIVLLIVGEEPADEHTAEEEISFLKKHDVKVRVVRRIGTPAKEILAAKDEFSADLIMMGGHGKHILKDFILGSTAIHIVHKSDVPVLVAF